MSNCLATVSGAITSFQRGDSSPFPDGIVGVFKLPTDPIGSATVTFDGVQADSEIRVFLNGVEVAGIESCAANQVLSWSVYNILGDSVRIVIASIAYENLNLVITIKKGDSLIPIQQKPDRWYKDPV
jgi:hypothetical protein